MGGKPLHIVIPGGDADEALFRLGPDGLVGLHKGGSITVSGKKGIVAAEQIIIMRRAEMQQEVHVESADNGLVRLAPFGNHGRLREGLFQPGKDLPPQSNGSLLLRVVLHQGPGHVHPEAVTAHG